MRKTAAMFAAMALIGSDHNSGNRTYQRTITVEPTYKRKLCKSCENIIGHCFKNPYSNPKQKACSDYKPRKK